jgi:hypothetical protein
LEEEKSMAKAEGSEEPAIKITRIILIPDDLFSEFEAGIEEE